MVNPGDRVVRDVLSRLEIPWFALVGDHDVHDGTFEHVRRAMVPELYRAFDVGALRAFAPNAFDGADPRSLAIGSVQLAWLDAELGRATDRDPSSIVFVHCYPTEFAQGGQAWTSLPPSPPEQIVEMRQSHYNALANDGTTLYIATGSTGQVEKGAVGLSITREGEIDLDLEWPSHGTALSVRATDTIQGALEGRARPRRQAVDRENAVGAWLAHGLVGTQLGPNKNGHGW